MKISYIVGALIVITSSLYFIYGANGNQTLLDKTIEHNRTAYDLCFSNTGVSSGSMIDTERYQLSTDCWKSQRKFTPSDLYLTVPKHLVDEGRCGISQSEDDHVKPDRGGMYATDIACKFEGQGVYAPDYLDDMKEYTIAEVGYDTLLGNFVILSFKSSIRSGNDADDSIRWYLGHTVLIDGRKVGDNVVSGTRFAKADLSGATTGWHTHIELRRMYDGVWQSVRYVTRGKERKLEEKRLSQKASISATGSLVYYFTHYDLGDKKQNDSSPCIGADGQDSCLLHKSGRGTMALTVDIRNKIGVKFGDKVVLTGEVGCEGVYTVTDEMACRFRGENAWLNGPCKYSDDTLTPKVSHIKRPGTPYYIKGDLPGRPGGACSITKL